MQRNCKAVQQGQHHLLSRKLDKGSSNKPLCVCQQDVQLGRHPATVVKKKKNKFKMDLIFIKILKIIKKNLKRIKNKNVSEIEKLKIKRKDFNY